MNKSFWKAAAIRSLRTFAQSMVSMIAVGAALSEVAWLRALSVSAVAALLSVLTSIATGLPEVQIEERKPPDEEPQIFIRAYDDYYEDGSPKRLGDVVFQEAVCEECDLTKYVEDGGGENGNH